MVIALENKCLVTLLELELRIHSLGDQLGKVPACSIICEEFYIIYHKKRRYLLTVQNQRKLIAREIHNYNLWWCVSRYTTQPPAAPPISTTSVNDLLWLFQIPCY